MIEIWKERKKKRKRTDYPFKRERRRVYYRQTER